jgi:integrase
MKAQGTVSSTNTSHTSNRSRRRAASFVKVCDGRKRAVRGLWQRNDRFYAQLTVTDPATGRNRVQRIPLLDKDQQPPTTVAQAVALMENLKAKRRESGLEVQQRHAPRLSDYVKHYLDAISAGEGAKKPRVVSGEKAMLGQWMRHLGDLRLDQIRKAHVNDFTTKRLKEGRSPRTINLNVIVLRNVLKRAVDDGHLQELPIAGLKPLKTTTKARQLVTAAEIEAICKAALGARTDDAGLAGSTPVSKNGQEFADYLRFLQFTGAREKEALRTRWQDVDFERGQVVIGAEGETKNRSARVVDFNPQLRAHLLEMRERYAGVSAWLFPSPQRGEVDRPARSFRESLKLVRAAAGQPGFGFHDCRHHFISMAVMAGIDFMTIAKWVGHRDGGVLIGKVYGHLADSHRKAMAEKLVFSSGETTAPAAAR